MKATSTSHPTLLQRVTHQIKLPLLGKLWQHFKWALKLPGTAQQLASTQARVAEVAEQYHEMAKTQTELTSNALRDALASIQRQEELANYTQGLTREIKDISVTTLEAVEQTQVMIRTLMEALAQGVTDEVSQLRGQHADCYDHLAELFREQSRVLTRLREKLDDHSGDHQN